MPETEPMSGVEVARAVARIEKGVDSALTKLDNMPDWNDINRQEARRDLEQAKQDTAIKSVETDVSNLGTKTDTAINRVDSRVNGLMMAVIVASLGAAGSIVSNLAGG